jgi:hypothetical protein
VTDQTDATEQEEASRRKDASVDSRCPRCHAPIEHPRARPDPAGSGTHTTRDCPNCHAPLIFYSPGGFVGCWRLNDRERRSRER